MYPLREMAAIILGSPLHIEHIYFFLKHGYLVFSKVSSHLSQSLINGVYMASLKIGFK